MSYEWLVLIGVAAQFIGIIAYIKDTLRGKNKPNKISWMMWAVAPMIATFAALSDGVGWSVLPVFMSGFGPLLVFISSFVNRNAYWKLERFDYLCGICSILALVFWGITREPAVAIMFAIASDAFAAVPTLAKILAHPETETPFPYITGMFSAFTSFAAMQTRSFSAYAFPAYLIIINSSLIFTFYRRKLLK
jgi:hypothetical protein